MTQTAIEMPQGMPRFPLLVDERETEGTKLAVIRGLHLFASSYGYRLSALDHRRETLRHVGQADESAEVRAAALRLLQRIERKVGEGR